MFFFFKGVASSRSTVLPLMVVHSRVWEAQIRPCEFKKKKKNKTRGLKVGLLGKGVVDLGGVRRENEYDQNAFYKIVK